MNESASRQPDNDEIDFPLWRLLDHTRYIIRRARELEFAQLGLTPEQAYVLDIVRSAGGRTTINRIVEMTQHRHHSMSALVERMAKQGLVRKRRSRSDKRVVHVYSTDKGESLFEQVSMDSLHSTLACLAPEEKKRLEAYLVRENIQYAELNIE